jgi:hypothetical protein
VNVRKPRRDKKSPADKMGKYLPVKLTPYQKLALAEQALRAGFQSAAMYLRHLATVHRETLGLTKLDYNAGVKD